MRDLVIRTHVSWYPQFLLALLCSRLTCDMVTFKRENMTRGKYACALIFIWAIKAKFYSTSKESIRFLDDICHNEFLAYDCPTILLTHIFHTTKNFALVELIMSYHEQFPKNNLLGQSPGVCLSFHHFRVKDDLPSSVPGHPSWDSQCRRVLLLLCKSLLEL